MKRTREGHPGKGQLSVRIGAWAPGSVDFVAVMGDSTNMSVNAGRLSVGEVVGVLAAVGVEVTDCVKSVSRGDEMPSVIGEESSRATFGECLSRCIPLLLESWFPYPFESAGEDELVGSALR